MDLTSPKTVREIQNRFAFAFKKGFGQNFLTSKEALADIVRSVAESGCENVIEIGPGFGTLTYELAKSFKRVAAIELDESLFDVLNYTLSEFDNVSLIHGDALKLDLNELIQTEFPDGDVSLAANLPYYAATQIIISLLETRLPLKSLTVMVQKEVAERICAKPASKSYGVLSVLCQYYAKCEIVTVVTADKFVPPPKIDSAVCRLTPLDTPSVAVKDEKIFFRTVKAAFSQRRKTLLNCLCSVFKADKAEMTELLSSVGIDSKARGEALTLSEFARLSDALKN